MAADETEDADVVVDERGVRRVDGAGTDGGRKQHLRGKEEIDPYLA